MKKLETKQIIGLAALAVGAMVVGKVLRDVKKIREMAKEKEEELLLDAEDELNPFEAEEAIAEEIEVTADEIIEDAIEEALVETEEVAVAEEAPAIADEVAEEAPVAEAEAVSEEITAE